MEMEDLESKMKDIQFIKVTREIQAVSSIHVQNILVLTSIWRI